VQAVSGGSGSGAFHLLERYEPRGGLIEYRIESCGPIVVQETKIRANVVHRKITAMGYRGSERPARRAAAEVKEA
jgi:hypothetical protein